MLARSFMTHDQLGLDEDVRRALIKVLGILERGEVEHRSHGVFDRLAHLTSMEQVAGFNMKLWCTAHLCGTVVCMGGLTEVVLGREMAIPRIGTPLDDLFCPLAAPDLWSAITVPQAAEALRNYLTTGEPLWHKVLAP